MDARVIATKEETPIGAVVAVMEVKGVGASVRRVDSDSDRENIGGDCQLAPLRWVRVCVAWPPSGPSSPTYMERS